MLSRSWGQVTHIPYPSKLGEHEGCLAPCCSRKTSFPKSAESCCFYAHYIKEESERCLTHSCHQLWSFCTEIENNLDCNLSTFCCSWHVPSYAHLPLFVIFVIWQFHGHQTWPLMSQFQLYDGSSFFFFSLRRLFNPSDNTGTRMVMGSPFPSPFPRSICG